MPTSRMYWERLEEVLKKPRGKKVANQYCTKKSSNYYKILFYIMIMCC